MVADIADVEVALRPELDGVRLFELCLRGRAAVAAVTGLARAGERGEDAGLHVDLAHGVVDHVDDVEVARGIEAELVRLVEGGLEGGPPVAGEPGLAVAGNSRNDAVLSIRRMRCPVYSQ